MRNSIIAKIIFLGLFPLFLFNQEKELPDDYLPVLLKAENNELVGGSEYLKGFVFSITVPADIVNEVLDSAKLFSLVCNQNIYGELIHPNGKKTEIYFEVVNYRGREDVYMKTPLGYFLWEMLDIKKGEISFAINWWYCPPAWQVDLEALDMADKLLSDSTNWHKNDDRDCEDDSTNNKWSLFCAIRYASIKLMGEYNHHNTAMQALRSVINELMPDNQFGHTLMDFNNMPAVSHRDILTVIERAKNRIRSEINNNN